MTEPDQALPPAPVPPWYWRWSYFLFGRRLPAEYGPWIAEQATGPGWAWRLTATKCLHSLIEVGAVLAVFRAAHGSLGRWGTPILIFGALLLAFVPYEFVRSNRRPVTSRKELFERQGIDATGRVLPAAAASPAASPAAKAERVRGRLLPRPEFEAVFYAVAFSLVLASTAAFGLTTREDRPRAARGPYEPPKARDCRDVDDTMRAAVEATLPAGTTIRRTAAYRYRGGNDDRMVVTGMLEPTPKVGGWAVWLLKAEGRGYRVTVSSSPPPGVAIRAPIENITDYQSGIGEAVIVSISCLQKQLSRQ